MVPTSEEYGCTPDEYGSLYPWKIMVLPLKSSPAKISIYIYTYMYFYSTPKKILSLCNLPLKNSICRQPVAGGMDIIMQ